MTGVTRRGDKRCTLREVADVTGAAYSTVAAYAQKAGWTENGKATLLTEEQATVIIEAMKRGANNQHGLPSRSEGVDTTKSRALRIDLLHRQIEAEMQAEIADLDRRLKTTEAAYGREVLDHKATKNLLSERETGLGVYQRICEDRSFMLSDQDDLISPYRGGR
jgi:hypothetical protein